VVGVGRRRIFKFYFDSKLTVLRKIFFFIHVYSIDACMKLLCSFCWFSCVLEHRDIMSSTWNIVFTFNNLRKYLSSPSDFNSAVMLWLHSVSCLFGFLLVIQSFCFWVSYFHLSLNIKYLFIIYMLCLVSCVFSFYFPAPNLHVLWPLSLIWLLVSFVFGIGCHTKRLASAWMGESKYIYIYIYMKDKCKTV
jgi:hypothetical protein